MLASEEYIEQAYWFRLMGERLGESIPLQEQLEVVAEELLATTKLPMAVKFLRSELEHHGVIWRGMERLRHFFAPFQTYLIREAEDEVGRFDFRLAVEILRREAECRAEGVSPAALFLYQFETLCRNRLKYDGGLAAMAEDPRYDADWRSWILTVRRQIGIIEFADLLYVRSDYYQGRRDEQYPALFGEKEGRIAAANRQKDPLLLFGALQRQLRYPAVPRQKSADQAPDLLPQMLRRLERMEHRIKLLEEEQREGAVDLSRFYQRPDSPDGG